jgi:hypothetical protein
MAPTRAPQSDPPEGVAGELPAHRRTLDLSVYERPEGFEVVARLRDERPWAEGTDAVALLHDMELTLAVSRPELVITAARAKMHRFPHAECTRIEDAFSGLVGLSVTRGYTRAVQERFGRALGCTHLEFLARAVGPAIVQAVTSSAARHPEDARARSVMDGGASWLLDTCHVWAAEGPGPQKLALGWRPGMSGYPAPAVADLDATLAGEPD